MMEKLIGRETEWQAFNRYFESGRSEFIAVYGRRRVGKTFLIQRFLEDRYDFYTTGIIEGSRSEEMEAFHNSLKAYGYQGDKPKKWMEAFKCLADILALKKKQKRCVVFMDEVPCFDTPRSGFVRALGYFWNSYASRQDNIFLIVCGSATSWMIRNILDNRGGLHNRTTHEMHLRPFSLAQTEEYFQSQQAGWDRLSILQIYMALGGVPYYLKMIDPELSAAENIDKLFFSAKATLKGEYRRLFRSLYNNPEKYMDIISALARKKEGMTRDEIAKATGLVSNGHLTDMLEDLVNCDFLRMYRNGTKLTEGIYQIIDFYTYFYHQFCKNATTDRHFWRNSIGTPLQNTWYGLAYERVCLSHVWQIIGALHLDTIHTEYYSWRSKTGKPKAQIDLVIDRADGLITLCEIKYSKSEYELTEQEYRKMIHRAETFRMETKTKKGVRISCITTFGIPAVKRYSDISQKVITLNDLFVEIDG